MTLVEPVVAAVARSNFLVRSMFPACLRSQFVSEAVVLVDLQIDA
jgi:hypothetical protein